MFKLCIFALLVLAVTANPVQRTPTMAERRLEEAGFFEGDMRFPPGRNALVNTATRWTSKTVYYQIDGAFSAAEKNTIIGALNAIQSATCVKFVARSNQANYVYVTRENSGCWSYVGMLKGRQQLNLQGNGCVYHGTAIHEFLHALGVHHQQSASDRDNYVTIQYANIQSGTEGNFDKYSSSYVTDFGIGYDYGSIMHYDAYAFSKNGQKTIVTKDSSATIGQRNGLSSKDIAKIKAMYSC
ncbi:unnamed protein product [Hermetia illucens]|uniref:Metalloendopeptidase n=1 Tax=Hermetia illucens TaxID=343691 RepID=A0A7R8UZ16_HERIL|nr:zinc metalloproteinase nas-15-like [Hermetia illucens]XP_037918319.1 zinc metalloproteinase nas-15-like [Hermetia illucens]XP_037918320.1 zinc metalloproteinase nas-15-like [Hermetia illucens]CAD7089224.1 unnamed protein product [Hermetia illucens]CAD7089225.1 unnamed protein product [Hermetia illucens]CAD7089226.1 unnamed protein product [Hermetia illucens]